MQDTTKTKPLTDELKAESVVIKCKSFGMCAKDVHCAFHLIGGDCSLVYGKCEFQVNISDNPRQQTERNQVIDECVGDELFIQEWAYRTLDWFNIYKDVAHVRASEKLITKIINALKDKGE